MRSSTVERGVDMQFFFNSRKNQDVKRFRAGDRVLCISSCLEFATLGETGTVLDIFPDSNVAAVKWDKKSAHRHNCGGRCEWGYGSFVKASSIEPIEEEQEEQEGEKI